MAAAPVPAAPAAPAPSAAQAVTPAPATRATPSATGLQKVAAPAALPGAMLHAQLYWGDTLLLARSFAAARPVFGEHADFELLALHGFTPNPGTSLIAPAGAAWNIAPPTGVEAFERSGHGWAPAQAAASKELKLSSGGALRLTSGRFHLDLVAQKAPTQVGGGFGKTLDWTLGALLVTLTVLLVVGVRSLPPMPKVQPLEREAVRHVQMQIEEKKPEKPKKPKPVEVQKEQPKPQSIQQATTLKQAGMPLKSLDKIAKATKGISNLLAALNSSNKGGPKNNLPLLPSLGQAPAPLPSLGGIGPGGPITKGNELLRGGNLGALNGVTAGKGAVAGVPVSVPSKPSKVQGSIDRDAVAKVINDHVNDMRGCWERALIHDPNIAPGKVLLEWTIGAEGDVTQVGTKSVTLKSNEVVSCLLNVLRELKFPKPNGGVVIISYPVLFNSVGY
ncbi:MAG: AgmX/PglI C-terminal domain-containing protein [Deltaproteobacteria bacterium]|nr:AgmX/PglI C-terminal domain-containing protein [Deltaproteobacteria bacterium]